MVRRVGVVALLIALATGARAETPDIALRKIFETLAEKATRTRTQPFYEVAVLRGQASREIDETYPSVKQVNYHYGPELGGKLAVFSEVTDGDSVTVRFSAFDPGGLFETGCLTFSEATKGLAKTGWSPARPRDSLPDPSDIRAAFERDEVRFEVSNFEVLIPFFEPWETAEGVAQIQAENAERIDARTKIVPGTLAYDTLCVTALLISYPK